MTSHKCTFTLAPADCIQYYNSPCRLRQVTDTVRIILNKTIGTEYEYTIYPEISYPQQSQEGTYGRVHYHGIITFKPGQKAKFYTEHIGLLNKNIRLEIDTISDMKKWHEYITKDKLEMETYCKECKTVYCITEQLPPPADVKEIKPNIIKALKHNKDIL